MATYPIEDATVRAFVVPAKRDRYATLLGNPKKRATILDRFNNVAIVKIVAADWVDYLQEAKFNGEWKIVNVLWELKPVK